MKQAVPKMIIQVGGSISFAPHTEGAKAKWLDYDTRHMLTELDPKPEFVTVTTGTTLWDITQAFLADDAKGTHLADPKVAAAWSGMVVDSTPAFYLEHLKRLRENKIQPYFVPGTRAPARDHRAADPKRRVHGAAERGAVRLRRRHDGPQSVRLDGDAAPHAARRIERDLLEQHARQHRDPDPGHDPRRQRARRQRGQHLGHAEEALVRP